MTKMYVEDGVTKFCDKDVCGRWCMTMFCVTNCVTKVCDKDVCDKRGVDGRGGRREVQI